MSVEEIQAAQTMDRLGLLLAHHGTVAQVRVRHALGVTGFGARHAVTLMHLAESGPMGQQALIEALGVDPSVLVTVLNDLERDGLAERRRDPADRRRHIVEMTEAGAGALTRVHDALTEVERELFGDLDQDEIEHLHRLLSRVRTTPEEQACTEE
ncbi:MarR family winged helix-turn-helix transcriptional regulator [Sphaerisporangium corydalis]|uniref:MarR family winged helix-turn-helix transcriptional regulator n=1 Tax=Sphaerisporangium corydalis TaxID=1441875 RepID=A0ABV9EAC6_9ACTN|nr:MarR family winged helix-turn-helix transcriptional regulator [Sphaerisporangium corydalis]